MFKVVFKPSLEKDLRKIPKQTIEKILQKAEGLSFEPFPYNCVKLTGTENFYRLRVGDYRIVYGVDSVDRIITVFYVRHRKDVYRGF